MKLGIISDIHNNLAALQAVLARFAAERCDGVLCCGDIIGIGAFPEETVAALRDLPGLLGCVRGNHERYLLEGMAVGDDGMGAEEFAYHQWEHARLSAESAAFLRELPYAEYLDLAGRRIYLAHYAMDKKGHHRHYRYTPSPNPRLLRSMFRGVEADIILYGHNHTPHVCQSHGKWYINCGSLGCPAREKDIARAGILTLDEGISFMPLRMQYDIRPTLAAIETFNFPAKGEILRFFYGMV